MTVKKTLPPAKRGSRMGEYAIDMAEAAREKARTSLKRSVKDKATGKMVYPLKDYQAYQKANKKASDARIKYRKR